MLAWCLEVPLEFHSDCGLDEITGQSCVAGWRVRGDEPGSGGKRTAKMPRKTSVEHMAGEFIGKVKPVSARMEVIVDGVKWSCLMMNQAMECSRGSWSYDARTGPRSHAGHQIGWRACGLA